MSNEIQNELRKLPAVEKVLADPALTAAIERYSHPVVTEAVRAVIDRLRQSAASGNKTPAPGAVAELVKRHLAEEWPGLLQSVINATGIILHTNLGRAPLSAETMAALANILGGYYALELDLNTGERGIRAREMEKLLTLLTGAESALVVNNNAAAVLLVLTALAKGREVIVSRSELVQIGGGFRVPDVMAQSGAIMREVGTTNQTFARDFEQAINDNTAMLLSVHRSNFALRGFTHDPALSELREIAGNFGLPFVYDLGSGAVVDTAGYGMSHEPTVGQALDAGADLVCVSGDKLLGGPQCGIILGKEVFIDQLRKHPLLRAVRVDKYAAVALTATVLQYLKGDTGKLPAYAMMAAPIEELDSRGWAMAGLLNAAGLSAEVIDGESLAGGGSLPDETLPTKLVAVAVRGNMDEFSRRLRLGTPPVLGRVWEGRFIIDLRTVFLTQDNDLTQAVIAAAGA
ncbi:MAG: L-seryl-tRNA(Sec) selenium transferase [Dehalogenimonas sp.]|uniref:L-seryl-tRNA(Sec) selenium transferase n=1 Tax=Candidatus Dehalogenimonas loeffleri TaxID=3127115 RepID=A0ABZ2J4Q9_9CHLR|nr:L-seryl-tRNA(Sec) selenium transferase [Dehalogenimonas sp.]